MTTTKRRKTIRLNGTFKNRSLFKRLATITSESKQKFPYNVFSACEEVMPNGETGDIDFHDDIIQPHSNDTLLH
jgi:hypothetical protein